MYWGGRPDRHYIILNPKCWSTEPKQQHVCHCPNTFGAYCMSHHSSLSKIYRQFLGLHGIDSALTCTKSSPNYWWPQVDSNQVVVTSQGCSKEATFGVSQQRVVNTYVNLLFLYFISNKFAKMSKNMFFHFVIMGYWVRKNIFSPFFN